MIITRMGHAAVLVETDDARVLIDPGAYSDDWHDLVDLDAVLVTHQHADHIDVDQARQLAASNPTALWVVEEAVVGMVGEAQPAVVGDSFDVGELTVSIVGGRHAVIHPDLDRIGNVGFVLQAGEGPRLFHPGDAYEYAPEGIDFLAVPLNAPWGKVSDTIDFVRGVGARNMFPIHDALLSEPGRSVYKRIMGGLTSDIDLHDPALGEPWVLD